MGRTRTYDTNKLQSIIGKRDGWNCKYCGCELIPSTDWFNLISKKTDEVMLYGSADQKRYKTSMDSGARFATVDHLILHSDGGADTPDNLVLACSHCNQGRYSE